ncbi:MAG: hypothetical protein Q4G68_13050 [Planctomycetia bacterium]|nr:hypothetical protein [Planctomycetia bacterium]
MARETGTIQICGFTWFGGKLTSRRVTQKRGLVEAGRDSFPACINECGPTA